MDLFWWLRRATILVLLCAIHTFYCRRFIDAIYTRYVATRQCCASLRRIFALTQSERRGVRSCSVISKLCLQFAALCRLAFCQFHVIRETKKNGTSLTQDGCDLRCTAVLFSIENEITITGFSVRTRFSMWPVRLSILQIEIFYSMNFATLSFIF